MSEFYVPQVLRAEVRGRAQECCEYCLNQWKFSQGPFVLEHVIPICRGGQTLSENIAFACPGCNTAKSTQVMAIDRLTNAEVPLFNPRTQKWREHFSWSRDHRKIVGRTAVGRATVDALEMNRENVQNLRWALKRVGQHPPRFAPTVNYDSPPH